MKDKSIGIFDSGVGGLTVVKHLSEILPKEDIIYFGDTARVPYGSRSDKIIFKYALQDINFLKSKDVKVIIAACGTVSSIFLKNNLCSAYFKDLFCSGVFYSGIIEKACEKAVQTTRNKNIGIIGTTATIKSKSYETYIKQKNSDIKTVAISCPLFVPIIEQEIYLSNLTITKNIIDMYLRPLKNSGIDTLILGCTHYPIIYNLISDYFENKINLIDPGFETAIFIKSYLYNNNLLNISGGKKEFFISDKSNDFENTANRLLNANVSENIKIIDLEHLEK